VNAGRHLVHLVQLAGEDEVVDIIDEAMPLRRVDFLDPPMAARQAALP